MSIRDIIEAAKSDWVLDGMSPKGGMFLDHEDDQRFIATFDPEHVALMEAVCEAADALPCCDLGRDYPSGSCSGCSQKPVCNTTAALTAYREERGL